MIREIMRDEFFLCQKSALATKEDMSVVEDLRDTLQVYKNKCVGMAANMIGVHKRIIIVTIESSSVVMINPVILKKSGKCYEAEEGCLSLDGIRRTKRYEKIKVEYKDETFAVKIKTYTGFLAQIIQHEVDHCDGIII